MCRTFLIFLGMCSVPGIAFPCTRLPAGSTFWIRLNQPISSHDAKPGMPVFGFLLESAACDGVSVLPIHIPVEGRVVSVRRVGLGLVHETANLQIEFTRIMTQAGPPINIRSRVRTIDNAREAVKDGVIEGIRSTETPQGEISSRLKYLPSLHLYPDPFLLGFKLLFPVFPEPEIYLPPGTDLLVELTDTVDLPEGLDRPRPTPRFGAEDERAVEEVLNGLPTRTLDKKSHAADVINMAFVGTREQLTEGFLAAGWKESDPVSWRSVGRQFHAFLEKSSYSTAPMSQQLYGGRPPELSLEKTFDSYGRRDHLRIWKAAPAVGGEPLWVGAAVRETGATLSVTRMGFIHHVSGDPEAEQQAIQRHLLAAGCVDSVGTVERPGMERSVVNATGEVLRTDGDVMVLRFKACDAPLSSAAGSSRFRPGSKVSRYLRKEILTVRSDLLRANCIYAIYRMTAATTKTLRHMSARRAEVKSVETQSAGIDQGNPVQPFKKIEVSSTP